MTSDMTSEYNEWYKVSWKSPKPELQKALNQEWYPAQKARSTLPAVIGTKKVWSPSPAMNCLPIQAASIPLPEGEMGECDLRKAWMQDLWGTNPAVLLK
eukprot:3478687-Rhodomonas_salina.1